MSFTWRDIVGLVAAALIGFIIFALFAGIEVPLVPNWSVGSLSILIIALVAGVIMGADAVPERGVVTTTTAVLGLLAVVLAMVNAFFNNAVLFGALGADLAAVWLLVTGEHAFTKNMYGHGTHAHQ